MKGTMSDWKVIDKDDHTLGRIAMAPITAPVNAVLDLLLGGETVEEPSTYTVKNERTGETREVSARNADELGDKISSGDFDDDDD